MIGSVTVLVPTAGRPEGVRRVLAALAGQADPGVEWQVLVVDNQASPRSREFHQLREAMAFPVPLELVHEPRPGASHARNRGVESADTEVVALLDDDVVPEPGWLRAVLAPLADASVDGVGGKVQLDPFAPRPRWLDDHLAQYLTHLDLGAAHDLRPAEYLLTANAAFRTAVLRQLGFDPRLGPRPGLQLTNDDLDLTRRALASGYRLVWQPDAVVVHDLPAERTRLSWLLRRQVAQGRSDWRLDAQGLSERGLRALVAPVRNVIGAPRRWHGCTDSKSAYTVHLLADAAHAVGFARESVAASLRRKHLESAR